MFAFVSFAAASLLDEQTNFDNVVAFDSLQAPGTVITPGVAPTVPSKLSSFCLGQCAEGAGAGLQKELQMYTTAGTATVTCGDSCTTRGRSLLQITGQVGSTTLTGLTIAELQNLQNNIAAGNVPGIPPGTQVQVTTPSGPFALAPPSPVVFLPVNPQSTVSQAFCSGINLGGANALNARLCCQSMQGCSSIQALGVTNNVGISCCPSTLNGAACFLPVVNVVTTTLAQVCAFAPAGTCGCIRGKHSKKGLLGLLGLLGLIPLCLCLLICCLCLKRRKRRGQAMLFSQTAAPMPVPVPMMAPSHIHAPMHAGPDFHVHP